MKKLLLLASMALAAMAVAIPATASATGPMFTDNGSPIVGSVDTVFSGTAVFSNPNVGSYSCTIHVTATIETTKGSIKKFEVTPETCVGTGKLEGCKLTSANGTGNLSTDGNVVTASEFTLVNVFESPPCPLPGVVASGTVTLTPVGAKDPLGAVTVSGTLKTAEGLELTVGGELEQTGETIGISIA